MLLFVDTRLVLPTHKFSVILIKIPKSTSVNLGVLVLKWMRKFKGQEEPALC